MNSLIKMYFLTLMVSFVLIINTVMAMQIDEDEKDKKASKEHISVKKREELIILPHEEEIPVDVLKRAKEGNPEAQFEVGRIYDEGIYTAVDYITSSEWYKKAAVNNNPKAQFNLANLYYRGSGVTQNKKKALRYYRKSIDDLFKRATDGDIVAQRQTGLYYLEGIAVAKNEETSFKWLTKAAEQNDPIAQAVIGSEFQQLSEEEAFQWLLKAAKQGLPFAQAAVGLKYLEKSPKPTVVQQDLETAYEWLQQAVNKNDPAAYTAMGIFYLRKKNKTLALEWFLKGAHMGMAKAQYKSSKLLLEKVEKPEEGEYVNQASLDKKSSHEEQSDEEHLEEECLDKESSYGEHLDKENLEEEFLERIATMKGEAFMFLRKAALQENREAIAFLELINSPEKSETIWTRCILF